MRNVGCVQNPIARPELWRTGLSPEANRKSGPQLRRGEVRRRTAEKSILTSDVALLHRSWERKCEYSSFGMRASSVGFMNVAKQLFKQRSGNPVEKNYNFLSKIIDISAVFV